VPEITTPEIDQYITHNKDIHGVNKVIHYRESNVRKGSLKQ